MPRSPRAFRSSLPLVAGLPALLAGCATEPTVEPVASAPSSRPIEQGPASDPFAFRAVPGGFAAALPAHDLAGRFTTQGAALAVGQDNVLIRATAIRREGHPGRALGAPTFALGDCSDVLDLSGACVRRIEASIGGVTEWWVPLEAGLEQGWTVERSPAGAGPLTLDVAVVGATARGEGASLWLDGVHGDRIGVSSLVAWDANGKALPAQMRATADGYQVRVDDAGAAYPVVIDPIYATEAWTITGTGGLGTALASAGDVNGDGFDDIIVGAGNYDAAEAGKAYVFYGSATGPSATASVTLSGEAAGNRFGSSVAGIGDVNKDGYDDVAVGALRFGSGVFTGKVYVYHGGSAGLSATPALTYVGPTQSSQSAFLGWSISGAGDVNNDGFADMIVGAPGYDFGGAWWAGGAYVFYGSAAGLGSTPTRLNGVQYGGQFGKVVSGGVDVNSDGYDDVIIGAPADDGGDTKGAAYLFYGSAAGLATTYDVKWDGTNAGEYLGASVAGLGDVDNDGYGDVAIGSSGGGSGAGSVKIHRGGASGIGAMPATTLVGDSGGDLFGRSVAGPGDVNGDGFDDVLVGAPGVGSYTGAAYVFQGAASGVPAAAIHRVTGTGLFGMAVSGAGDVDNDGWDDVLVGTRDANAAFLYRGYRDDDGDGYAPGVDCNDKDAAINPDAQEVCDAANVDEDCDGKADNDDASADKAGLTTYYVDADADFFGSASTADLCDKPAGYALAGGDCNDNAAHINPDGTEVCDAADNDEDCDGTTEDADSNVDPSTRASFWADADGDTWGSGDRKLLCEAPAGHVNRDGDCNDSVLAINPEAQEVCDAANVDEDCSGAADDADPDVAVAGFTDWYADTDGDGYGDGAAVTQCDAPTGSVDQDGDCAPDVTAVNPGATDIVGNGVDDDCDGGETCYADADNDGYRTTTTLPSADGDCDDTGEALATVPSGDCDDAAAGVNPGAVDTTGDGIDTNCDTVEICFADADADGHRPDASATVVSGDADCDDAGEADAAAPTDDCNDEDATAYAGATEIIGDEVDQDCNGTEACYADIDKDGFRADEAMTTASDDLDCDDDGESAADDPAGDCNDLSADYHPGATEDDCEDPNDYNCDGSVGYDDADDDGFAACAECDDSNEDVNPDAAEVCNEIDDNCDDEVDNDATDATTWYGDADGDAYTVTDVSIAACAAPDGYAAASTDADCDDDDAGSYPGADEVADDGIDQDCDGSDLVGGDTDTGDKKCGCASGSSSSPAAWGALAMLGALLIRRRRA